MKQKSRTCIILILLIAFSAIKADAQTNTPEVQQIVAEGKKLYKLEMSAWAGTDVFLQLGDKENAGGYFSYGEGEKTKCIFYSKGDMPKVIGSILFDSTYKSSSEDARVKLLKLYPSIHA